MGHSGRLEELQSALPENKLDVLLITHLPNIRYLCGFTGSAAALLVSDRGATLFTDGRYIAQARAEVSGAWIVIVHKAPYLTAAESLATLRTSRAGRQVLGIEGE